MMTRLCSLAMVCHEWAGVRTYVVCVYLYVLSLRGR